MNLLPRRSLLAVAAVVDIAHHARPAPIAAKTLAARHNLPPRHLETLLQVLVRASILKGVRGPRGGYELARERRKITVAEIIRAVSGAGQGNGEDGGEDDESALVREVVVPAIEAATLAFLDRLEDITVEDLCDSAQKHGVFGDSLPSYDFTI
ncbi:Rrf2 family transcriptional regulator [Agaricicola taiwanensis]|uniref:Rrf2 family transcriptional regulator n=1 Tax=Agaricicola taiwanensis TaxID=591372 RepID=A0A8J2VKY0_9RHOB|nr:Rrf2 family transcriptional regulator [Agaricicola taiwanensis]GGE29456.1 Rrf2 family transcriptional regulator [Agaricicola taiwanensis]